MMFNHEDYTKRADAMRDEIQEAEDQSWRGTVDMRYALFITANSAAKMTQLGPMFAQQRVHTTDSKKFDTFYANDMMQAANSLHLAASLLFGLVTVGDPIGCEVIMRMHAAANTPSIEPAIN